MRKNNAQSVRINAAMASRAGCTATIEPLEGRQLMSASVSGIVFNDVNAAGGLQPGDPRLAGVRVYADLGNHNAYKPGDPTAFTNTQGAYTIPGLSAGSYVLRGVVPAQFRQTLPGNGLGQHVNIASNSSHVTGVNFGDTQKVRVSGYVYDDANSNGARGNGEGVLAGATVYLDANSNKKLDPGELHTTSNGFGYWVIGDLPPGHTYTARVALTGPYAGYVQTQPAGNGGYTATLQKGQTLDTPMFGIRPASIVLNSENRTVTVTGGSHSKSASSTGLGAFNASTSINDPSLGDGGSASMSSNISATALNVSSTLSTVGSHDEGFAGASVDMTFTLTAATPYHVNYHIDGNRFAFALKKLNNGGGNIINNGPNELNPGITTYNFNKNGTLAAGKYELSFDGTQDNSNIFATYGYSLAFSL